MVTSLKVHLRGIDRGLLLAIILCLIAAWPFLLRASLPRETDTELHVFRASELGYAIRGGDLYPRWAPDFYYGYGYPIFNYYAPLTYYLANLVSLAIPGGAVLGVKAVYILGFLGAGVGMYKLGSLENGSIGGLIGASSYLFAPYIYMIDPHLRGDLAEFFALGLAPIMFWLYTVHMHTPSRRAAVWASLAIAAVVLTHNLLGILFFALLIAYGTWSIIWSAKKGNLRSIGWNVLPLVCALGVAAFFLVPVALEGKYVQLGNLIGPGHFDYRNHFLSLLDLISPSLALDLGAVNPAFRFNLGLAQLMIGFAGLVTIIWGLVRKPNFRSSPLAGDFFWLSVFAATVFMMTGESLFLWDTVPGLPFFQFPWRLLGPAALMLAIIGSKSALLLKDMRRFASPAMALIVALPLLGSLPIFEPPAWDSFGTVDQEAMLSFELRGLALGTTSTGDFVPSTVDVVPGPSQSVIDSYSSGGPIDRINRQTLPEGADVQIISQGPTSDTFQINTPNDFVLRIYRFAFPGWHAEIDGKPVSIDVAHPEGFITVAIPSGHHELKLWLGLTPARTIASSISLISVIMLAVMSHKSSRSEGNHKLDLPKEPILPILGAVIGSLVIAIVGHEIALFQPHSTGITAVPADYQFHRFVQGGVDLIGYDAPEVPIHPGESFTLTLYWKAREPVPANYQVFSHVTTIPEHTWGQSDKLNPGDYPTSRWPLDRYVRDPHQITIPLGTPPGAYAIRVGLWNGTTGIRQLILQRDGTILGDSVTLPTRVTILPALQQPALSDLPILVTIGQEVAPGITLLGINLDPGQPFEAHQGLLTIILYWKAEQPGLTSFEFDLRLLDEKGQTLQTTSGAPADGIAPTNEWNPGEVIRDVRTFWVDDTIQPGTYTIEIREAAPVEINRAWLSITAIQRLAP